jgi:hypothetical protein
LNRTALLGFILGLVGAAVDFASGYLVLSHTVSTNTMGEMMVEYSLSELLWGVGLFALGALLVATSLISVSSVGLGRMGLFGDLMLVYGIAMLIIGSAMYSGVTPMMSGYLFSSAAMFVVGIFMIASGALMRQTRM